MDQQEAILRPLHRKRRQSLPRESPIVRGLITKIRSSGGEARKTTGGAENSGDPDIIGCWRGRFLAIETKRPGSSGPTIQQLARLERWKKAGAIAFWTDDAEEAWGWVLAGFWASSLQDTNEYTEQDRT